MMRIIEKNSGIFVTKEITSENWQEAHGLFLDMAKHSILNELKEWEDEAMKILHANGFKFPCKPDDSAPLAVKDAVTLVYSIMGTRDFIKRNDAPNAALCAFRAGNRAVMMMVRPAEKPAVTGRKNLQHLENLRERLRPRNETAALRNAKVIQYRDELMETYEPGERPKANSKEVITTVKNHFGMPYYTVKSIFRRAAQNPIKKNNRPRNPHK
jgi:hypothetical protein